MPIVKELFGFPLHAAEGRESRKKALCPFMDKSCDGGGNRDMARLSLQQDAGIRARFDAEVISAGSVACGICSISTSSKDWIICPRRLLNFADGRVAAAHQNLLATLCRTAGFATGSEIGVWPEITVSDKQGRKTFNYRLDYVLREKISGAAFGPPMIVEIMTCSTSGGNKKTGTDMATSFSKALLSDQGDQIKCPNVNVRQVWSRMAGQMIVKSEAANKWGGRAIWVVQDLLANYISENTGLALEGFRTAEPNEVNIIASTGAAGDSGVLYAGPISSSGTEASFGDILRAPFIPDYSKIESKTSGPPSGTFIAI